MVDISTHRCGWDIHHTQVGAIARERSKGLWLAELGNRGRVVEVLLLLPFIEDRVRGTPIHRVGLRAGKARLEPYSVPGNSRVRLWDRYGLGFRDGKMGVERGEHLGDDGASLDLPLVGLGSPLLDRDGILPGQLVDSPDKLADPGVLLGILLAG